MNLTREQCREMKGLAILSIVFHNYLHQPRFGFAAENEFSFEPARTLDFFHGVLQGVLPFLCETISFLGWAGVPVFVFLSGYGLAKKHETDFRPLPVKEYLFHSWKKLFLLLLPAILLLLALHWGDWGYWGRNIFSLTMLANLFTLYPSVHVYWYFGLTFELYCLYILFNRRRSNPLLLYSSLAVILLQFILVCFRCEEAISWNLHNFLGWIPVFSLGVYAARRDSLPLPSRPRTWGLFAILAAGGLVLCNLSRYPWIFSHFFALALFLSLTKLVDELRLTRKVFLFFGGISSFLFVAHPLARTLANLLQSHLPDNLFLLVCVYFVAALALAFLLRAINRLPRMKWAKPSQS